MNREEAEKKVRENKCEYPNCQNQAVDQVMFLCQAHLEFKQFILRVLEEEHFFRGES